MMKRNQEPFIGTWDLPGGFMSAGETPEETVRREIKEELGTDSMLDFVGWFPGKHIWKGQEYAILDHAYLAELKGEITLNEENSAYEWRDIQGLNPTDTALSSNQAILAHVKEKFGADYPTLVRLVKQLDPSAEINEINLYRSILNGYMSKKIVDGRLVGAGWIFPRRTFLRKQAVIEDMIVDESERGKGYGKEIVLDLIRWAREQGVEVIELTSNPKRVAANELYKRVGFELHPTNHYLYRAS
jgi:ADP-ribose pyrophosphatase YjhB (NUDIX family)